MTAQLAQGVALQQGRYTIGPTLGEGGFGVTYRGEDTRLNRKVAIKELFIPGCTRADETVGPPPSYTDSSWVKAIQSFLQEARTLAGLDYPGIVPVYDYFEQNNTAYMVMKFVAGTPLGLYVHQQGGTLPENEALRITQQVGRALAVVHANNLLHRDIKPANIILTPTGQAVLVDFGAAREFSIDHSLLQTAVISAGFSPPEQFYALGRKGPYSDAFSLAATCYFMIAGVTPGGEAKQPPSPRTFAALNHALAYNAADRPQSVADFLAELSGRKPVPADAPLVLSGNPAPSDPARTVFGTPSFVPTHLAAPASALPQNRRGDNAVALAAPVAVAAIAPALSATRLAASTATTHVVNKPAPRTGPNQSLAPVRSSSGMHLTPVAVPRRENRGLWLALLILLIVGVALTVALSSSNRTVAPGIVAAPSPTLSPTVAPSPSLTPLAASPTRLPAPVLTAPDTLAPPSPTRLPGTAPKPSPTKSRRAASPTPALRPNPTRATIPNSSNAVASPTAAPSAPAHPSNAPLLPTHTAAPPTSASPTSNPAMPTATYAPGQPTRTEDDPHRHINPPPTATPIIILPTATEMLLSPTLPSPPQTEEPPTLTPEPPPTDTPLPPPSETPKPQPSDTPLPPPTDTPVPPEPSPTPL